MNDLISRQLALTMLNDNELERQADDVFDGSLHRYKRAAQRIIAQLPSAEKRGEWFPHPTDADWNVCSVCGIGTHMRFHYNEGMYGGYDVEESFWYCPHCGARMDGEE